jgi:toxin secretion/phage lysis holin
MERFWTLLAYALALIAAWWAGLHNAYRLLAIFQAIDIALGVLAALNRKRFRSNIGLAGITRRAATWLLILAVAAFERETGPLLTSSLTSSLGSVPVPAQSIGIAPILAYGAALFEFSSILENCQAFGVKIPSWFTDLIRKLERTLGLSAEEKVKS